jgi:hypothetical protein
VIQAEKTVPIAGAVGAPERMPDIAIQFVQQEVVSHGLSPCDRSTDRHASTTCHAEPHMRRTALERPLVVRGPWTGPAQGAEDSVRPAGPRADAHVWMVQIVTIRTTVLTSHGANSLVVSSRTSRGTKQSAAPRSMTCKRWANASRHHGGPQPTPPNR